MLRQLFVNKMYKCNGERYNIKHKNKIIYSLLIQFEIYVHFNTLLIVNTVSNIFIKVIVLLYTHH